MRKRLPVVWSHSAKFTHGESATSVIVKAISSVLRVFVPRRPVMVIPTPSVRFTNVARDTEMVLFVLSGLGEGGRGGGMFDQ
jgi:hypothetical protein